MIEYAIRDVLVRAERLERKGKKTIYLNIGDPVKFDFDIPSHIKRALGKSVKKKRKLTEWIFNQKM